MIDIHTLLLTLPLSFVLLGIQEAIIKPLAIAFINKSKAKILQHLPAVFNELDYHMPDWLSSKDSHQLQSAILGLFEDAATDFGDWSDDDKMQAVREIVDRYDILKGSDWNK